MRGLTAAFILAVAFDSLAATSQTNIQLFSVDKSAQPVCRKGLIRAVPRCSGAGCAGFSSLTAEWAFHEGSAEASLALGPEVSWEISIEGKNCWAAPLLIAADNQSETRTAFVWPAATITGVFTLTKAEKPPVQLHASVEAADTSVPGAAIPQTSLDCFVDDRQWGCSVPATAVDLRLEADGFAPRYIWGLAVPAGEKKSIDLALTRGPSVSGRVAFTDRRAPIDGVAVELRPAGFASGPADERRISMRSRKTTTGARGFFQFSSIDDGAYDIVVTKKGWSTVTRRVRVGAAKETDTGVLMLPPLARAEVIIDPALDAKGRRWRVVLDREELPSRLGPIADKQAAADGTWTAEGIMAGSYRLNVYDGGGVAYERVAVNIQPGEPPIRFHMDALIVRGVVRIGQEPLAAALRFMNTQAPGDLDLTTDDRGAFAGTFPAEGRYEVDISPKDTPQKLRRQVEVRPNADGIINLDIELPGGVIRGKVVDEAGNPVAAAVQILPGGSRRPMSTTAGEDGRFKLIAVESGDVVLNARDRSAGESGPTPYAVADGASEPVTLTLHPRIEFTMWLVSPAGQPVSGAVVRFSDGHYSRERISGPGGDIQFEIARGIPSVDIVVAAAGFPVRMMNLPVTADMNRNPQVVLGAASALLVAKVASAPPWPGLRPADSNVNLHFLPELFGSPMGGPSSNRTARGYEFELDPGKYVMCPEARTPSKCVERTLSPGTETIVDFESLRARESTK
jgi:hypothetical protein